MQLCLLMEVGEPPNKVLYQLISHAGQAKLLNSALASLTMRAATVTIWLKAFAADGYSAAAADDHAALPAAAIGARFIYISDPVPAGAPWPFR